MGMPTALRAGSVKQYAFAPLNLTTLAPDIVAASLDETLLPEATLFELAAETPAMWEE
jgi:hypothetical protein